MAGCNRGLVTAALWLACAGGAGGAGLEIQLLLNGSPLQEKGGSAVEAGTPVRIGFRIHSAEEGTPLSGLHPGAWIRPRVAGRRSCRDAARAYLGQGPNAGPDISLNGYTFLTLNQDRTLAVMDPQLNLATSNLLVLTPLPGRAVDWRLSPAGDAVYLALEDTRRVMAVDPLTGRVMAGIELGDAPVGLAVFDRQSVVWVAGSDGRLMTVDPREQAVTGTLRVGKGKVLLATDPEQRRLFAYAAGDGGWLAVDIDSRERLASGNTRPGATGLAYSPLAERLYLAYGHDSLVGMTPARNPRRHAIEVGIDASSVQVGPAGRWLLAADGGQGAVALVDTATESMSHGLQFRHPFDQVVFSRNYAYLRHTDIARVSLIHLPSLRVGKEPGVIEVPFGAGAPGGAAVAPPPDAIAPLPEGGGAVVVNPADRTLFLYMEDGMRAPMNAFKSWTAPPLAVLIHDRSLRESRPGVYQTASVLPQPGAYEVVFHLPNPPLVRCWPLDVGGRGTATARGGSDRRTKVEIQPESVRAGRPVGLEIGVQGAAGLPDRAEDLRVLLFRPGSSWQYRAFAEPLGQSRYRVSVTFPRPGRYKLALESRQLGLGRNRDSLRTLEVRGP